jgi:ADP-ribose pyrophosphatase YjhB (NUDIX family)
LFAQAAGILPYSFSEEGELFLLLGREDRTAKAHKGSISKFTTVWLPFGGKREGNETPLKTALREFAEETLGIFSDNMDDLQSQMEDSHNQKLWHEKGKYVLYFWQLPFDLDLPLKFESARKEQERSSENSDQVEIGWVSLASLTACVKDRNESFIFGGQINFFFSFFLQMMSPPVLRHLCELEDNKKAEMRPL